MNRLNLIIALLFCIRIHAQQRKILIHGTVKSNNVPVENIHIINLSAHTGSLSDTRGEFQITVKENDILLFSGIQYNHLIIIIDKETLKKGELHVNLIEKINQLDDVDLSKKDLTGYLITDSGNFKDSITQKGAPLNLEKIDFKIPSLSVAKQLDPDNLSVRTDQTIPLGGDIIGLINMVTGESISKLIKKIKTKNEQKEAYKKKRKNVLDKIRKELGDQFFTNDLHLDPLEIDKFLIFCRSKGIVEMYLHNQKLEMIDLFFKESKTFISSR